MQLFAKSAHSDWVSAHILCVNVPCIALARLGGIAKPSQACAQDLDGDIGADRMEGSDYGDVASDDAVPQMTLEKLRCHVHIALALMWLRMISMPCNLPSFTALLQVRCLQSSCLGACIGMSSFTTALAGHA